MCSILVTAYDLATQCPSRRASAKRHSAKCTIPLTSLTGTTSLPQSRPQSRQHAGLTDSSLSQGPSPNISLNPSPSLSPQPRARQPRRAYTIAEGKDEKAPSDDWEDDADRVRDAAYHFGCAMIDAINTLNRSACCCYPLKIFYS